jgi:hypothetical protein
VSRRIFKNVFGLKHVIAFVGKLTDPRHNEKLMRMLWSSVPKMLITHAEMMNFPLPASPKLLIFRPLNAKLSPALTNLVRSSRPFGRSGFLFQAFDC